ncbi:MAG: hypothetical protein ACXADO_00545 [Candidatus Thorarchaeota archaeon]
MEKEKETIKETMMSGCSIGISVRTRDASNGMTVSETDIHVSGNSAEDTERLLDFALKKRLEVENGSG